MYILASNTQQSSARKEKDRTKLKDLAYVPFGVSYHTQLIPLPKL